MNIDEQIYEDRVNKVYTYLVMQYSGFAELYDFKKKAREIVDKEIEEEQS